MKVTAAAKRLSGRGRFGHEWPESLPHRIYRLRVPKLPQGEDPMSLGEEFHLNLKKHLQGEWITKEFYYSTNAVAEILQDLGFCLKHLKSEIPVVKGGLSGVADLVGQDPEGRNCIFEIKTTQGHFALAPQPWELAQLSMYADMLNFNSPRLICIRINLRLGMASVFLADFETEEIRKIVKAA